MGTSQNLISPSGAISTPSRTRLFVSAVRYLSGKALTILVTFLHQMEPAPTVTPIPSITSTAPGTEAGIEATLMPAQTDSQLVTYTLDSGEYPYCIARRLNVDPLELLRLNGLLGRSTFPTRTVLQIPQTAKSFPGERRSRPHPTEHPLNDNGEFADKIGDKITFLNSEPNLSCFENFLNNESNAVLSDGSIT